MSESTDHEDRMLAAIATLQIAHDADPRACGFGMFVSDDHPWSVGMFHWFEDEPSLVHAMTRVLPVTLAGIESEEVDTLVSRLVQAVERVPASERLGSQCVGALQAILRGLACLDWVGTFDSLSTSEERWPSELRAQFRDSTCGQTDDGTKVSSGPIAPEEQEAFVEYLGDYGY